MGKFARCLFKGHGAETTSDNRAFLGCRKQCKNCWPNKELGELGVPPPLPHIKTMRWKRRSKGGKAQRWGVGAFNLRRLKALPTTTDRITSSWELPRELLLGFPSRPRWMWMWMRMWMRRNLYLWARHSLHLLKNSLRPKEFFYFSSSQPWIFKVDEKLCRKCRQQIKIIALN